MIIPDNRKRIKKPRVGITPADLARLFEIHGTRSAPVLARRTGLPYLLVYNVVNGRAKSVSGRHYRTLFGETPPFRDDTRVDGTAFRAMVALWLFLVDDATRSDIYRDLYGPDFPKKPDLRIFSGAVRTVPFRLEHIMREKFAAAGLDDQMLGQWLDEMQALPRGDRVAYERIRPVLRFLQDRLGIHPTAVLNQSMNRYEKGCLKRVSRHIYNRALGLQREAEKALATGDAREIETLKEEIAGKKTGYTLFVEVAEELQFLQRYAQKSPKCYLGRGAGTYRRGRARRIADWRAETIRRDCDRFIRKRPDLPLASLPRSRQGAIVRRLVDLLVVRTAGLLFEQEGIAFEKRILSPQHANNEYKKLNHGFTRFEMASRVLGMKQRAFDLMVAGNCEIFRAVGRYSNRWYLSNLYLTELSRKKHFELINAKYELMARRLSRSPEMDACLQ